MIGAWKSKNFQKPEKKLKKKMREDFCTIW